MGDALTAIFYATLKREGKNVERFTTKEKFRAFFRRSNDNNTEKNTMTMYYPVSAPVKIGSLISYKGYHCLVLNQETVENDVYMRSGLVQTNGVINTNNHTVIGLPFWGDTNVNNAMAQTDSHLSTIDGNVTILTEDCPQSRKLSINDTLNEWGRTWQISNIFFIDGICHIALEVIENREPIEVTCTVSISGLDSLNYAPGDIANITATAFMNDTEANDATIIFESSNTDVATISEDGAITFISDGEVYFTAKWVEYDVSYNTDTVTVLTAPVDDSLSIYVAPLEEIDWDFPETLAYYGIRGGTRDDTIPVSFKVENLSVDSNYETWIKKIIVTDNGDHTVTVDVDTDKLRYKTFDLVAYIPDTDVEYRQTIKIVSFF